MHDTLRDRILGTSFVTMNRVEKISQSKWNLIMNRSESLYSEEVELI